MERRLPKHAATAFWFTMNGFKAKVDRPAMSRMAARISRSNSGLKSTGNRDATTGFFALGFKHRFGCAAFGRAISLCDHPGYGQSVPVLHDSMPHIGQLRLTALGLAVKPALRVGRALMRVILALLTVEVLTAVAAPVLRAKALLRRPGLDQGPVHRKMLIRQQRLHLRVMQELGHELLEHLALLQALAVLRKRRWIPHPIIRGQPNKPAIEKVVVQLFHQLPFRAHAV